MLRTSSKKRSSAQGGFTVLELLFVMFIVAILAVFAIPAYVGFIQKARETAVVSYLSKIKKAEEVHKLGLNSGGLYSNSFDILEDTGIVPPATGISSRVEHEYTFDLTAGVDGSSLPYWRATAAPLSSDASAKWFYIDDQGPVRYETGAAATASSPVLKR